MLLQSMAIVVKKLLVDDKKSAFAKQIQGVTCKVLNRKAWAYGKAGSRNPESRTGAGNGNRTGTGTGTGTGT